MKRRSLPGLHDLFDPADLNDLVKGMIGLIRTIRRK